MKPAPFDLAPAELAALVATWDLGTLYRLHPELAGWRCVVRAGRVTATRRLRSPLRPGKQIIPARPGETVWERLLRLGAQAALNGVAVRPLADGAFAVSSQDPACPDRYRVETAAPVTCTCKRGQMQLGAPCAHIGAVYLYLCREAASAAHSVASLAAQAAADLYGSAA